MAEPEIEALSRRLEAQTALQRESDHRVKNTLQLISSLVLLHSRRASEDSARQALRSVLQRVNAVSVAHRHVSRTEDAEQVEVSALLRDLVGDLAASAGRDGITLELDLESVVAPARHAAPLALLVGEAVGNCLRHAFPPDRPGRVQISVHRRGDEIEVAVADDGVGLTQGAPAKGFGSTIMELLARQMRGRLETTPAQPGLRVSVHVPMERAKTCPVELAANVIGTAAALCSMASFVPQIIKIRRERDASSVSLRMYAVTVSGFSLWIAYGLLIGSWPVAASNAVCLVLSATILVLKWRYSRH